MYLIYFFNLYFGLLLHPQSFVGFLEIDQLGIFYFVIIFLNLGLLIWGKLYAVD